MKAVDNQITFKEALEIFGEEGVLAATRNFKALHKQMIEEDLRWEMLQSSKLLKGRIKFLKEGLPKVESFCREWMNKVQQAIYTDTTISDTYKEKVFIPLSVSFCYDIWMNPLREEISLLENRLRELTRPVSKNKNEINLDEIRRIPISNYIKVNSSGFAPCIFHKEKTASLMIDKKNRFYCFGCHKSGDVIDIYMEMFNVDFKTAINVLKR